MGILKVSLTLPNTELIDTATIKALFETFLAENGFKESLDSAIYTYLEEI